MNRNKIQQQSFFALSLGALGIVFGDIGTSPLYALRESLEQIPITPNSVLGILSLIFWALIIIVSFKYLCLVFRADNEGEGGILALLALLKRVNGGLYKILFLLGILGACLMLGDGMLTPAISVVSAIEGLKIISPGFSHWILPITTIILIALFTVQSFGTAKIGFAFGPILLLWFITLAVLGTTQIIANPIVLHALNPVYGIKFLYEHGLHGYLLLGGVFLVVTGGEALYADLGHFSKNPIRMVWFFIVLPCLVLNYFGQGAYLLNHPAAITNPFYSLAPGWFAIPLLIIATLATIIASQAVITATFSLTKQAILLGLSPYLPIVQTSASKEGQIYIPQMNFILALGTLILIATFKSSDAIAHAYGIAVNLVMVITTIMIIYVAYKQWRWSIFKITLLFALPVIFDLGFLGANSPKILTGGWAPVLFALVTAMLMITWNKGMGYLREQFYIKKENLGNILKSFPYTNLVKLPETTTVFIADIYDESGGGLIHFLKLTHTLPENLLVMNYVIENIPYVPLAKRFEFIRVDNTISQLTLHYGFMDNVSIPRALSVAVKEKVLPFTINFDNITYLVEAPNIIASRSKKTLSFYWQEKVFAYLMRNYSSNLNIEFYRLPHHQTIAIGSYCII